MGSFSVSSLIMSAGSLAEPEVAKRNQSSRDFEALLVGQLLHSVRDEDSGWLGSSDGSSDAAFGLGEEQLAQAIAGGGGFGLAKVIDAALARQTATSEPPAAELPKSEPATP